MPEDALYSDDNEGPCIKYVSVAIQKMRKKGGRGEGGRKGLNLRARRFAFGLMPRFDQQPLLFGFLIQHTYS